MHTYKKMYFTNIVASILVIKYNLKELSFLSLKDILYCNKAQNCETK